jgi:spermidine synthase
MSSLTDSTLATRRFCLGVGVTSGASLALSLLFTRIFSVTMYYHFAFLLVSLALLGIAVAGVAISLLPNVFREDRLPWLSGMFALSIAPLALLSLKVVTDSPLSVDLSLENTSKLIRLYFATAMPFLASGFAISLAIAGAKDKIGTVYAFDMGGAALGCVLIVVMIPLFGAQGSVVLVAALAAAGGALLASSASASHPMKTVVTYVAIAVALGLFSLAAYPMQSGGWFKIAQGTKFLREDAVEFERWNSFSRVTVSTAESDYKWLHIDADAATRMYSGEIAKDGYKATRRFSEARVASIVYALRNHGPALVIGPGGGPDIISALRAKVPRVIGVEVNPIIADVIMKGQYVAWNGDLYRRKGVEVHVDDGRSFVRRSEESYSSIQATLVDTWAASAAGAFTLSENNLYTADAFVDYLNHLTPDGVLSMTRWYGRPPIEFYRLAGLGREALNRLGIADAQQRHYFYVVADNRMATMLLKAAPFASDEIATLDAEARASRLAVLYRPIGAPGSDRQLAKFFETPTEVLYPQFTFDVRPVTDDRPFFFYTVRGADFLGLLGKLRGIEKSNLGLAILQLVLIISTLLTIALVLLPLWLFRRGSLGRDRGPKLRLLGYFLCLGFGFILVELGLMQRFILFLGHPIYALAVVLAALLGSSGVGSALSGRLVAQYGVDGAIRRAVAVLAAVLLVYAAGLGPLFNALLGLPISGRVAISMLLVAMLGVLMGVMLPLGVRIANGFGRDTVAWAWGINGAASVVGSTLSLILSMHFGFTATLLAGLVAYLVGAKVIPTSEAVGRGRALVTTGGAEAGA